jgi:hypothetical protein
MTQTIALWGSLAATFATAIATFFLWRVTKLLAVETKRMADASAQPQVVANIVLNKWAMNHADLEIENTGNATAFDIEVNFDPPLENGQVRAQGEYVVPFQKISVLKPAQSLSSYLTESAPLIDKSYMITTSWRVLPNAEERQSLSYTFRMSDYKGMSMLGAADPAIQIAEQVKKFREDWKNVASGQRKLKADIFTDEDRRQERRMLDARFGRNVAETEPEPSLWNKIASLLRSKQAP